MSLPPYITTIIGPPARLAIVRHLAVMPMTINELCAALDLGRAAVRRPLLELVAAGLVRRDGTMRGRSAVYRLDLANMRRVRDCIAAMSGGAA